MTSRRKPDIEAESVRVKADEIENGGNGPFISLQPIIHTVLWPGKG